MTDPVQAPRRRSRRYAFVALAPLLIGLAPRPAVSGFVVSVESETVVAGSTNNTLQVNLANSGLSALTIGGFAFEITASAGVSFTSVDIGTSSPYIFAGHSTYGSDISNQPPTLPGSVLDAYDIYSPGGGGAFLTGNSDMIVGLGDVHFDVAAGVSGPISITLTGYPVTNFSDAGGDDLTQNIGLTLVNGIVEVSTPVPEPSSLLLTSLSLGSSLGARSWLRRRGKRASR